MWPALAILATLAGVALHFRWRRRYRRLERRSAAQIERMRLAEREMVELAVAQRQSVFDSMIEGVLLLDEEGRVEVVNRRFVQFFNLGQDVRGRSVMEATRSHELAELIATLFEDGATVNRVLRLPGPEERHLEVNAARLSGELRQGGGAVVVIHDVTRLKQLERTREEFVANVSHELRSPLSLIKGYTETLLDGAKDDDSVRERFLDTIHRHAQRLQLVIEDLLTISALESGKIRLNRGEVSLRALADRIVEDFCAAAGAREVRISATMPDLNVLADANRLYQVLGNLVDNAIKYGRAGGTVKLEARALEGDEVEVRVTDDGLGIPSDALHRVFERFYRVDKGRSRDEGGTGLGLSIVKHIVQSHGGRVWVESELGRGAVFLFTLPQEAASRMTCVQA